jgi:hypothetical protein
MTTSPRRPRKRRTPGTMMMIRHGPAALRTPGPPPKLGSPCASRPPLVPPALPPLGVGGLIGGSIRLFLAHRVAFGLAAFLPAAIAQTGAALAGQTGAGTLTVTVAAWLFSVLAPIVPITRLTVAAAAGEPVRLRAALKWGEFAIGPMLWALGPQLLMLLVTVAPAIVRLATAGKGAAMPAAPLIALVLWGVAALSVAISAVLLEGARYGALGRSFQLTRGYRWPIVGANLGVFVLVALAGMLPAMANAALGAVFSFEIRVALSIVGALLGAVLTAPIYILPVLIYRRLIDIKEGGEAKALAEVFA